MNIETTRKRISERIRTAQAKYGINKYKLATAIAVKPHQLPYNKINSIDKPDSRTTLNTLLEIAGALNLDVAMVDTKDPATSVAELTSIMIPYDQVEEAIAIAGTDSDTIMAMGEACDAMDEAAEALAKAMSAYIALIDGIKQPNTQPA